MSLPKLSLKNIRSFSNHIKWAHSLTHPGMNKKKRIYSKKMRRLYKSNNSNKLTKRKQNRLPRHTVKKTKDKAIVLTPRTIRSINMYVSSIKYF